MNTITIIKKVNPASAQARAMAKYLWEEIQTRYGFMAPDPFDPCVFAGIKAGLWIAFVNNEPVGSMAIAPLSAYEAELDLVYVAPFFRGSGIAQELLSTVEEHAKQNDFITIKLRAGAPQPEALRFYEKMGFKKIPTFGKWVNDDTAICFGKNLIKLL